MQQNQTQLKDEKEKTQKQEREKAQAETVVADEQKRVKELQDQAQHIEKIQQLEQVQMQQRSQGEEKDWLEKLLNENVSLKQKYPAVQQSITSSSSSSSLSPSSSSSSSTLALTSSSSTSSGKVIENINRLNNQTAQNEAEKSNLIAKQARDIQERKYQLHDLQEENRILLKSREELYEK